MEWTARKEVPNSDVFNVASPSSRTPYRQLCGMCSHRQANNANPEFGGSRKLLIEEILHHLKLGITVHWGPT